MDSEEGFMSIEDLAKYLNLKKRTAYHLVQTLQIPHYRVGRLVRFRLSEIEEWMNTKKVEPIDFSNYECDSL